MKLNSTKILLSWSLTIGVMISMSSNSWFMMWAGIEISMMSFLPLMALENLLSSESCMKYFIIQSASSMIMISGMLMMMMKINVYENILMLSLMMKLGAAPFHNWVLSVMEGMTYLLMMNLLVTMKLAPLSIVSLMNKTPTLICLISMVIGSIMGINQNSIRSMIGYSSIFNLGAMMMMIKKFNLWISSIMIYSMLMMMTMIFLTKTKANYLNQTTMNQKSLMMKMKLWVMMLSLGGMPPTMGFMLKIVILETLIETKMISGIVVMTLGSLTIMFYYMRMATLSMMYSSMSNKISILTSKNISLNLIMMNILSMPLLIYIKILS
uniref:NADH-ubiquinone oxidoreductase chain 2 n=1 Tax=Hylica paradoxa TaxID=2027056 RepID=A0A7T6YDL1_9HEMI|nr:NADH dehydrogenase subunit 2 [Hylica paradoxa]QQK57681.1 NADH dehydrogenase subunit 2 [Hylica paradoxa]